MTQQNDHNGGLKWVWRGLMGAGGILAILAIFAHKIGISTHGFGYGQFLLLFFGILLFLAGASGRRFSKIYKGIALIIINTMVLFLLVELVSSFVLKIQAVQSKPVQASIPLIPYYASQSWSSEFWQEWDELDERENYQPWVIWRSIPFTSTYLNIDNDGIRRTPNSNCVPGAYKVFTFGGSTMWGYKVPDWATVPAYLQDDLSSKMDRPVCTVNLAQIAFVSKQGLLELMTQLQNGNIPDLVIFYDGANDVFSAYQSGKTCVHMNLGDITAKFERMDDQPANQFLTWLKNSYSYQLINSLVQRNRQGSATTDQNIINYKTEGVDTNTLANDISSCYYGNYDYVKLLADKYGFKFAFFWQPIITIGNKPLTAEEQSIRSELPPAYVELFSAAYQKVKASLPQYANVYYIADVLDNQDSQIWMDEAHVTPVGNKLIADEMARLLEQQQTEK